MKHYYNRHRLNRFSDSKAIQQRRVCGAGRDYIAPMALGLDFPRIACGNSGNDGRK
jgi:hypothetical protein